MTYLGMVVNACGNEAAARKNLIFKGDSSERGKEIAKIALQGSPDFIFISELAPVKMASLIQDLEKNDYKIFYPKNFRKEREKWRYTCVSVMAIRKGIEFSQSYLDESKFQTTYRYISGTIQKNDSEAINILGVHVPQVGFPSKYRISRKQNVLNEVESFMSANSNNNSVLFGDLNVGYKNQKNTFYCQEEFDRLLGYRWFDTNVHGVKTFDDQIIDHCFASPALMSKGENTVTMIPKSRGYKTVTDHKILEIKIS